MLLSFTPGNDIVQLRVIGHRVDSRVDTQSLGEGLGHLAEAAAPAKLFPPPQMGRQVAITEAKDAIALVREGKILTEARINKMER